MVVRINGGYQIGQLLFTLGVCIILIAAEAMPIFYTAGILTGGGYSVHLAHSVVVRIIVSDNTNIDAVGSSGGIVEILELGKTYGLRNAVNIFSKPNRKLIDIVRNIEAGEQIAFIKKIRNGFYVSNGNLAAVDRMVVGGGSGTDRKLIGYRVNGVVIDQLLRCDIEISVERFVSLVVPSQIHIIICAIDLDQIPCVIFITAATGNNVGRNAGQHQQLLKGAGITLADGLAFHQSAVSGMRVITGIRVVHMLGKVVVKIQFLLIVAHVRCNAGQSFGDSSIISGTGSGERVACKAIMRLNKSHVVAVRRVAIRCAEPEVLGVIVLVNRQHHLEIRDGNRVGRILEGNSGLAGFHPIPQFVISPNKILAVL